MLSPCNWDLEILSGTNDSALASLSPEERARVESMATDYLWHWTGQQFGECSATIRPCRQPIRRATDGDKFNDGLVEPRGTSGWWPVMLGGKWYNLQCGSHGHDCGCSSLSTLVLPQEVTAVEEVRVAGAPVDPNLYVQDGRRLVRTDGKLWPVVFSPYGPDSTAFELDVLYGTPVPEGGKIAAGVLAIEFAKALRGDNGCQLPRRLQTITREGVTIGMMDTFEDMDKGHTGIYLVDSWVSSIMSPPRASRVYSPDTTHRRFRHVR